MLFLCWNLLYAAYFNYKIKFGDAVLILFFSVHS